MAHLAPKTKVLRDGRWQEEDASTLVPGDIISIKLGDIIPADARDRINNLLVLLIEGIPMPTVLSVTMAIGSHKLSQEGAITKRMTAIEEMAAMNVL
ncbi:hypothetical protein SUGI_0154120 [Cryptomeria japonica]|nr:hypothetical protein SUGI_0154120 [Cryptomeria japonica]